MADSWKTTTSLEKTSAGISNVAQQMDSTRMTTANVSHHNQQKVVEIGEEEEQQQRNVQSSDIVSTKTSLATAQTTTTTMTTTTTTTTIHRKLHSLLGLPASMELSQIELIYRAEGNANLVLALPQFKKVLRLPKNSVATTNTDHDNDIDTDTDTIIRKEKSQPAESSDCNLKSPQAKSELQVKRQKPHKQAEKASDITERRESQSKDDLTMKDFVAYMQIFRQLLGDAYVLEPDICWIHQEEDRKWINKHIKAARPAHRLDKEFCGQFGLLMPDAATQLPSTIHADILHANLQQSEAKLSKQTTYAIEIKPKQGWHLFSKSPDTTSRTGSSTSNCSRIAAIHSDMNDLFRIRPTTTLASPTTLPTSTPKAAEVVRTAVARCRYCAMQFLKLKNHKISHMNTYCPIELFSGTPYRMLNALDALFRCPQNNLRVFRNGILIYGDHSSSIPYEDLQEKYFPGEAFKIVKMLLVECLLRDYNAVAAAVASCPRGIETIEIRKTFTDAATGVVFSQPHSSIETKKIWSKQETATLKKIIPANPDPEAETETKTKKPSEQHQIQETETTTTTTTMTTTKVPKKTSSALTTKTKLPGESAEMKKTMVTSAPSQVEHGDTEILCLPENCVLHKILHLQLLIRRNFSKMYVAGYENYNLKTYNSLQSLLSHGSPIDLSELSSSEQYLLGATALDSSIMITFQEIASSADKSSDAVDAVDAVVLDKYSFRTKVTVLDLDPKSDAHFSKYIQLTRQAYDESSKN